MSVNHIDVVAGIIFNEAKTQVLLSLRKPDQHQGNCWEFPGGKIEANESIEQALLRELDEELGIQVSECEEYCQIEHRYVDKAVRLHFWQVSQFNGVPSGRENQQLCWYAMSELAELAFPEANRPIVRDLLAGKVSS